MEKKYTSEDIFSLLQQGNKKGLELLFEQYYRPLVMYAMKFVVVPEEAEDVVQDIFIQFWERNKFKTIESNLRSYLYQSVYHKCMDLLEGNKRNTKKAEDCLQDFSISEMPDEEEWEVLIANVYQEIDKLPQHTRTIFNAIVLEGKPYKTVAQELDISVNTIKTSLSRAMTSLRKELGSKTFMLFSMFW